MNFEEIVDCITIPMIRGRTPYDLILVNKGSFVVESIEISCENKTYVQHDCVSVKSRNALPSFSFKTEKDIFLDAEFDKLAIEEKLRFNFQEIENYEHPFFDSEKFKGYWDQKLKAVGAKSDVVEKYRNSMRRYVHWEKDAPQPKYRQQYQIRIFARPLPDKVIKRFYKVDEALVPTVICSADAHEICQKYPFDFFILVSSSSGKTEYESTELFGSRDGLLKKILGKTKEFEVLKKPVYCSPSGSIEVHKYVEGYGYGDGLIVPLYSWMDLNHLSELKKLWDTVDYKKVVYLGRDTNKTTPVDQKIELLVREKSSSEYIKNYFNFHVYCKGCQAFKDIRTDKSLNKSQDFSDGLDVLKREFKQVPFSNHYTTTIACPSCSSMMLYADIQNTEINRKKYNLKSKTRY